MEWNAIKRQSCYALLILLSQPLSELPELVRAMGAYRTS
jgi:hypothetical protein